MSQGPGWTVRKGGPFRGGAKGSGLPGRQPSSADTSDHVHLRRPVDRHDGRDRPGQGAASAANKEPNKGRQTGRRVSSPSVPRCSRMLSHKGEVKDVLLADRSTPAGVRAWPSEGDQGAAIMQNKLVERRKHHGSRQKRLRGSTRPPRTTQSCVLIQVFQGVSATWLSDKQAPRHVRLTGIPAGNAQPSADRGHLRHRRRKLAHRSRQREKDLGTG